MKKLLKLFFLIISFMCCYNIYLQYLEIKKVRDFFKNINGVATIDEYTIYGNHLNIKGNLKYTSKIDKISMVLKNLDNEKEYPLIYKIENGSISFELSKNINKGIDLEKLTDINHYLFIKIINNDSAEYYSLKNETIYENLEYFTLTRNNKNYKIKLYINEFQLKKEKVPYFKIKTNNISLDDEFYDIVIDPGHGGTDSGALSLDGKCREADVNLMVAKELKKSLKQIGLKVKLTREEDITLPSYGKDGRAVIPNNTKAKLLLSIHLNSSEKKISSGGVEIYTPNNIDYTFALLTANNIVSNTNVSFSKNQTDRIFKGVYTRTFDKKGIDEAIEYAKDNNYEPYNITTSTPVLYMLRETGGIMTGAYIDGRNTNLDSNPYYNSNITCEAYLIELGYINYKEDLDNILNNYNLYVAAITNAVKEYYSL